MYNYPLDLFLGFSKFTNSVHSVDLYTHSYVQHNVQIVLKCTHILEQIYSLLAVLVFESEIRYSCGCFSHYSNFLVIYLQRNKNTELPGREFKRMWTFVICSRKTKLRHTVFWNYTVGNLLIFNSHYILSLSLLLFGEHSNHTNNSRGKKSVETKYKKCLPLQWSECVS